MVEQLMYLFLGTFRKIARKKRLLASSSLSLRPSSVFSTIRMEQLGSHWTDCHDI